MLKVRIQPDYEDLKIPNPSWGIFWISVLGLFLQMLFIRWIGTEIRIFAYLQNTILVVCFLGLGLGMLTASKPIRLSQTLIPLNILLLLMAVPVTRSALANISELLSSGSGLLIWYGGAASEPGQAMLYLILGLLLTFAVLIFVVDIFVPIGRILGRLMDGSDRPIFSYSINILGSVLGTWFFVALAYFYLPPIVWFMAAGALIALFIVWTGKETRLNFVLLGVAIPLAWFASQTPGAIQAMWSPYQKLMLRESRPDEIGQYVINVNNVGYQAILDLGAGHVSADPENFPPEQNGLSQYDLPLIFHPNPETVLIVGAGSGNDVAGALRQGAGAITAVEIDPAIIAMGIELHPEKPYLSPNVRVVNDDARSFFATTSEAYDVISFGLLDSHTTTSMTNARLDHYVYTRESIIQAGSLLADGGIMVLTFEATKPYIINRMYSVLEETFGQPPLVFRIPANSYGWGGVMFVTGDLDVVQAQIGANPRLAGFIQTLQREYPIAVEKDTKITTDDWPYLYLESPHIPPLYFFLTGLMVLIFARSYRKWQAGGGALVLDRAFWHFFFLGAAFLLLEVQNISKASVVLGNTWQVNAVIVTGILSMALLANWMITRYPDLPKKPAYLLLIGASIGLYFLDLARFGFLPYPVKAVWIGALTSLPMLFSGMVFAGSFAAAKDKSRALGANLIGALCGALLQSITFVTGVKALLLIVALLYLFSSLSLPKEQN